MTLLVFLQMSGLGGFVGWLVCCWVGSVDCVCCCVFAAGGVRVCCFLAAGWSCVLAAFLPGRLLAALQLQGVVRCLTAFREVLADCFQSLVNEMIEQRASY